MRSSDTARMRALVGSVISVGVVVSSICDYNQRRRSSNCSAASGSVPDRGAPSALRYGVHRVVIDGPTALDWSARRAMRGNRKGVRAAAVALSPLYPIGLPGSYIAIAHVIARALRRRRRRGGSAIVTAAWCGWLAHRGAKLVFQRERPWQPGRRRHDSFPSGHTTGATALALTIAYVLHREGLISTREAMAIGLGAPALMGAYRVIADDHWATDVVAGWILGSVVAAAAVKTGTSRPRRRRRFRREPLRSAISRGRSDSPGGRGRIEPPSAH